MVNEQDERLVNDARTTRRDLGVKPGESDPARMLAWVLVLAGLALTLLGLLAMGWLW